jgi:hypothetical protein
MAISLLVTRSIGWDQVHWLAADAGKRISSSAQKEEERDENYAAPNYRTSPTFWPCLLQLGHFEIA